MNRDGNQFSLQMNLALFLFFEIGGIEEVGRWMEVEGIPIDGGGRRLNQK